jgi:hypothetical protein
LPEKKVFIDGRMPSWRWKLPAEYSHESAYAYNEYRAIVSGEIPIETIIKKYHITTILIPTQYKDSEDLLTVFSRLSGRGKKRIPFLRQVQQLGWQKVYQDAVATTYKK